MVLSFCLCSCKVAGLRGHVKGLVKLSSLSASASLKKKTAKGNALAVVLPSQDSAIGNFQAAFLLACQHQVASFPYAVLKPAN